MYRLLYLIIFPFLWLASVMPLRLLYIKSDILFLFIYYVIGYRKKVVYNNLMLVFPEKSDSERTKIARKFYRHLCDFIFETIKGFTISEKTAKKRFSYENLDLLDSLYQKDRSILILCGHYASWEWSGIIQRQMNYKGLGVYKKLDNKAFDKFIKKIRGRFGPEIISNKKVVKRLFRLKSQGEPSLTLFLADQTPKAGAFKHRDTFMGIDVPVFTGTEELAKKLDFTTLYLKISKVKRGFYKAKLVMLAEDPTEFEDFKITRLFLDQIENQIAESPYYYLWSHKRWKLRN